MSVGTRVWRQRLSFCASGLLALAAGCGGSDGGTGPGPDPVVVVVSNAVAGTADTSVVWVSLLPGTLPAGITAEVSTRLADGAATVTMLDGGFDPIPLPALDHDTVTVVVRGASGEVASYIVPVPMKAPPIVVRTYPPKSKKDVPLNLRALVVFSEPMDRQTVTPGTVRLLLNGQPVAGAVVVSPDGLRGEFLPSLPLAASSDYVLEVTTGAASATGGPLEAPVAVPFTPEPQPVTLTLTPQYDNVVWVWCDSASCRGDGVFGRLNLLVGCNWRYDAARSYRDFDCWRSLMRFDLSALSSRTILSAKLRLTVGGVSPGFLPRPWSMAALSSSWHPGTVTWTAALSFIWHPEGNAIFAPPSQVGQTYTIDLTLPVQHWVDGTWANDGIMLLVEDRSFPNPPVTSLDGFKFWSKESTGGGQPELTITYR